MTSHANQQYYLERERVNNTRGIVLSHPSARAFFAHAFSIRAFPTTSEPGTGYVYFRLKFVVER